MLGGQTVDLVCVCVLEHYGIIVMLWFNVCRVDTTKLFHKLVEAVCHAFEQSATFGHRVATIVLRLGFRAKAQKRCHEDHYSRQLVHFFFLFSF